MEELDEAVSEHMRGRNSQASSSHTSLGAVNVEAEELSQSAVNEGQRRDPASLPLEPFTGQVQSSVRQREPSRPVCHSAPPFEPHVDPDPSARRRVEFPVIDGAVHFP